MDVWYAYDTTLRDGLQEHGREISLTDAVKFATELDQMGFTWIEAGFASAGQDQMDRIRALVELQLPHSRIAAFGRTRGKSEQVEEAVDIRAILASGAPTAAIVGKSRLRDVTNSLLTTPHVNLVMVAESIDYLKQRGREVIFDAEHFFDGIKDDPDYAVQVIETAHHAGADYIVLCDTNGSATSDLVRLGIKAATEQIPVAKLGFHGHNDRGRGVSNAELAFLFGIRHIQGTINGYGERCGNTDLCTLIPNLYFDYRAACLMNGKLERLTDLSRMTAEFVNAHHRSNHPWVGHLAGHTEAGMHASGEGRDPGSYLHADLTLIGNRDSYGVSEQSGRSNIFAKAKELGFELSAEEIAKVTDLHNRRLAEGYSYAAADASLHLLIMEALGLDHSGAAFTLEGWHVDTNRDGANLFTEATIRASLDNVYAHEVGSGDGPVDALNSALRKVLDRFYPELPKWKLSDYKVRIVNPQAATAAKVRVLIETSDKQETWTTVGVHENIIEASWIALVQSVAYAIHRNGKA